MTHQRLNIGDLLIYMQWKPIANKYRKGTMKSTLQPSVTFRYNRIKLFCFFLLYPSAHGPSGVKKRVKSPYSEKNINIYLYLLNIYIYKKKNSAKYNWTEYLIYVFKCIWQAVIYIYIFILYAFCFMILCKYFF